MKLAIVTACPNGMVTSVISARLLEAAAQRLGWTVHVEVQDPQHPEARLSAETIAAADWVLVVSSGSVDLSRFAGKRLIQAAPADARDARARRALVAPGQHQPAAQSQAPGEPRLLNLPL